jgi:hypothetical protein
MSDGIVIETQMLIRLNHSALLHGHDAFMPAKSGGDGRDHGEHVRRVVGVCEYKEVTEWDIDE